MPNDFDIASLNYDETFTFSKIGKAQRKRVFKCLNPIINNDKKLSILELNCGTGEDAIYFGNLGHEVLATDISEGMIDIAKNKIRSANVIFKTQDITAISKATLNKKFDLIFSNFGGFNCLSRTQIDNFLKDANELLNPNGKIVLVIMPKNSLWERIYFTLKGDFREAKRRQTNNYINANVDGIEVKTWYYNPKEIQTLTKKEYVTNNIKPIGLSIPPSYLEKSFFSNQLFMSVYKVIDLVFTSSFWAKYADHFLIELTKK